MDRPIYRWIIFCGAFLGVVISSPGHPNHQLDLIYTHPGEDWERDGLPLGNGFFGALLLGGVGEDRIRVSAVDAEGLLQPVGDLVIRTGHDPATARTFMRRLDLQTASVEVSYRDGRIRHRREYFASYPDRALVGRLRAVRKKSIDLEIRWNPVTLARWEGKARVEGEGRRLQWRTQEALASGGVGFRAELEIREKGGQRAALESGDGVRITDADEVTLLLRVQPAAGSADQGESLLADLAHDDAITLYQRHLPDYQEQFHSMYLTLEGGAKTQLATSKRLQTYRDRPEEDPGFEELLFQYGRYLTLGSSRVDSPHEMGARGLWWFPPDPDEGIWDNRSAGVHPGLAELVLAGAGPSQMAVKPVEGIAPFAFPNLAPWAEASSPALQRLTQFLATVNEGKGNEGYGHLRSLLQSHLGQNLLMAKQHLAVNMGLVRGMTDLFAVEKEGVLHWEERLPEAWPDGSVVGLRTPHYEIAYVWQGGEFFEGYLTRMETGETAIRCAVPLLLDQPGGETVRRLDPDAEGVVRFPQEKDVTWRLRRVEQDAE